MSETIENVEIIDSGNYIGSKIFFDCGIRDITYLAGEVTFVRCMFSCNLPDAPYIRKLVLVDCHRAYIPRVVKACSNIMALCITGRDVVNSLMYDFIPPSLVDFYILNRERECTIDVDHELMLLGVSVDFDRFVSFEFHSW